MVVSRLGRFLFFSSDAATKSMPTVIVGAGNAHLRRNKIVVPLQQLDNDMGLCSFQVDLSPTHSTQDIRLLQPWHLQRRTAQSTLPMRLGHMRPRSMKILRRKDGNGIDNIGTVTGCVKSRNITFPETPTYVWLSREKEIDYTGEDAYVDGVTDHASFLDPFISGNSGDTPDMQS